MAMTSTITQPLPAQMGQPCTFVVAVINGGGSQVKIQSMQPVVKLPNGSPATCCTVGPLIASPQLASANTGANQFNVPVAGNSTTYFTFQVSFFGPAISGGPTQPSMAFVVDCLNSYDDNTSSGCLSPIQINLNQPQFGQAPGYPPNAGTASVLGAVPVVGQLNFQVPANGGLGL